MERLGGTALCQSAGDCAEPSQPVILDKGDSGRLEDLKLLGIFADLFITMLFSFDQFYNVLR